IAAVDFVLEIAHADTEHLVVERERGPNGFGVLRRSGDESGVEDMSPQELRIGHADLAKLDQTDDRRAQFRRCPVAWKSGLPDRFSHRFLLVCRRFSHVLTLLVRDRFRAAAPYCNRGRTGAPASPGHPLPTADAHL